MTPPIDDTDNVVVEAPSTEPAPGEPAAPPVTPAVPAYENAWPIGLDEAAAVVAELWDDGTFVVDGAGDTLVFENAEEVPWLAAGVADDIKRVVFADKVAPESLAHWFEGCANLEEVANVPAEAKDVTRLFFDCPKLVELPDDFAIDPKAKADECFAFAEAPEEPVGILYRGEDAAVLAYDWAADGRELATTDALEPMEPVEPPVDGAEEPAEATDSEKPLVEGANDPASDAPLDEAEEKPADPDASADPDADALADPDADQAPVEGEEAIEPQDALVAEQEAAQLNITVPSSVSMALNVEGENTATIPVMVANRSEQAVAITGARLKRSGQDLPGGSWSLTTEGGATTFVSDARFTPLGLEASFERPVILAAGDEGTMLVWHGSFTDYGMKILVNAVIDAGDSGFAYGSMIWIVSAA